MVKLIVGGKGAGKTKRLVEDLNREAENPENNIVCILRSDRLDSHVKYKVRMIDLDEYPVSDYDQLLAFIAGLNAKDYDITHIYIDSINKIVGSNGGEVLAAFLANLEEMAKVHGFQSEITYSAEPEDLHESLKQYVK